MIILTEPHREFRVTADTVFQTCISCKNMHKNLTSLTCLILKICSAYQQFTTEKKNLAKSCKHHLYKTITETKSFAELLISRDFSCSLRNYFLFKDCIFSLPSGKDAISFHFFFFFGKPLPLPVDEQKESDHIPIAPDLLLKNRKNSFFKVNEEICVFMLWGILIFLSLFPS